METKERKQQIVMVPVESSNIEAIGKDSNHIRFKSGGATYFYPDAPKELFAMFREAESKGKFFLAHIKNQYPGARVHEDLNNLQAREAQ